MTEQITIMDVLNEIDLETFQNNRGTLNGLDYEFKMIGTVQILNSIGDWKDYVARNLETLKNLLIRDSLPEIDMTMCFPHKGVGYHMHFIIRRKPIEIEVGEDKIVEINSAVDNKTKSRKPRKDSDVQG